MRVFAILSLVFLFSCTSKRDIAIRSNHSEIISYLKTNFHITLDTMKMDSFYRKNLRLRGRSLQIDSLMNAQLEVHQYQPLGLELIRYDNDFGISDSTHQNHFRVFIIHSKKNNFYTDYIDPEAGFIRESFCMWSYMNTLKAGDVKNLSGENRQAFNAINSQRVFGMGEFNLREKKFGIQSYLNNEFRFELPKQNDLQGLFKIYDSALFWRRDTLLADPIELYDFLSIQSARIRSEPDYGSQEIELRLLKDQVVSLLMQSNKFDHQLSFIWIYKNGSSLRWRKLGINGNSVSSYMYYLDEGDFCL